MRTLTWDPEKKILQLIDQRVLPARLEMVECRDSNGVVDAIRLMIVRGAPAIGVAAAFGMALAGWNYPTDDPDTLRTIVQQAGDLLRKTRPTAINLNWAIGRMLDVMDFPGLTADKLRHRLEAEAIRMAEEDVEINCRMAEFGASLIEDGDVILHHCNTGSLAAVDWGTALGAIRLAHKQGKRLHVLVDETRPRLQGSRLTAWELTQYGISFDIIVDGAAGYFLQRGDVQKVMFGADRVAANGDVANKIGTYMLALAAEANRVPVICVAPSSSIDLQIPDGSYIPIEERDPSEVLDLEKNGEPVVPRGAPARNPAFDITPHQLISAIVTEFGITRSPYDQTLAKALGNQCLSNNPARHSGEQENPIQ